jgi:hypothetical protein
MPHATDTTPSSAPREDGANTASPNWRQAHDELERLARTRTGLDLEEGRWLLAAFRCGTHRRLGYGSFGEYVARLFGYSTKWTREKLRVAEALESLPHTTAAIVAGTLLWSAARELTRVSTPETEREWLATAEGQSVRQIERRVAGHQRGSRPSEPRDPSAERHVVRFELSAEAYATLRAALGKLHRDGGGQLDDEAAILQMARQVLRGSDDAGRASYQIAVSICPDCGRGEQEAHGRQVVLDPAAIEMAECDAQHIGRVAIE